MENAEPLAGVWTLYFVKCNSCDHFISLAIIQTFEFTHNENMMIRVFCEYNVR